MAKKYFTGFCVMNSADLRANPLHHSCLVFFEGDCNEFGQLRRPLKVVDAYGFYSHPIPERPSIFTPVTLFAYAAGVPRISGNYGEWRRENIHDLALGRGLSGRLFEMHEAQFQQIRNTIKYRIIAQNDFFEGKKTVPERESHYQSKVEGITDELIELGINPLEAEMKARNSLPISEFTPSYNCKVAALDMIESSYAQPTKELHEYIQKLKSSGISSIVPRFTDDLDEIIIHAETDNWEVRGNNSKYPFYDWKKALTDNEFQMYAINYGSQYIDKKGNFRSISNLSDDALSLIRHLKIISRICDINLHDRDFKHWGHQIHSHVRNIARQAGRDKLANNINHANDYLHKLLDDPVFKIKTTDTLPTYLGNELRFLRAM